MALLALAAVLPAGAPAEAAPSQKKAIWGPAQVLGVSQFPIYAHLGAGIYQTSLRWEEVARNRPARAGSPADPAYHWPSALDYAVYEASLRGIAVAVQIGGTPAWANGGRRPAYAPRRPADFARFAAAASRRYPAVRHWMVYGEPLRSKNFRVPGGAARVTARRYAQVLDEAYVQLKSVSPRNLVVGGNTATVGTIAPLRFARLARRSDGRAPRMDLWGHNPFTVRSPNLSRPPLGRGNADFSDLDTLARVLDRHQRRGLRLFLSEFTLPTDHANREFNFYVTRRVQADWLRRALRITRRWKRIYTLGWIELYDEAPRGPGGRPGDEVNRGLLDWRGRPKPAYQVFRRG